MNAAAAFLIKSGEEVIIMGFELTSEPIEPAVVLVDKSTKFLKYL
jgi:aspartate 1-decarboxylase